MQETIHINGGRLTRCGMLIAGWIPPSALTQTATDTTCAECWRGEWNWDYAQDRPLRGYELLPLDDEHGRIGDPREGSACEPCLLAGECQSEVAAPAFPNPNGACVWRGMNGHNFGWFDLPIPAAHRMPITELPNPILDGQLPIWRTNDD